MVEKIEKLYKMDIKHYQEKIVPIKSIWLYPVRGIKGFKVQWCEITPHGLKNDRTWVILSKATMKPIANHNSHVITFLRQVYNEAKPNEVKLCFQDKRCFPDIEKRNHMLYFDEDRTKAEFIEGKKNYRGYKECDEVC